LKSKHRFKNDPGKNDFSKWINWYFQPKGNYQFMKLVVVLTSRSTASAVESFVMSMRVLPHTTIAGDATGGGVGDPVFRELPNGWT
jgi:C-terminal processing protease CtpA/Prc